MQTFYFTFGTDNSYPFFGGHVEVLANTKSEAIAIYNAHHEARLGLVNCEFIYNGEEYRKAVENLQANGLPTELFTYCHAVYKDTDISPTISPDFESVNLSVEINAEDKTMWIGSEDGSGAEYKVRNKEEIIETMKEYVETYLGIYK